MEPAIELRVSERIDRETDGVPIDREFLFGFLFLIALSTGALGWFPSELENLVAFIAIPAVMARLARASGPSPRRDTWFTIFSTILVLVAWPAAPAFRLASIAGLMLVSGRSPPRRRPTMHRLAIVIGIYAIWWSAYTISPHFNTLVQRSSVAYTAALGRLVGYSLGLGATASAAHIVVLSLIAVVAFHAGAGRGTARTIAVVASVLALHVVHVLVVMPSFLHWVRPDMANNPVALQLSWLLLGTLLPVGWWAIRGLQLRPPTSGTRSWARSAGLAAVLGGAAFAIWPRAEATEPTHRRVVLYDKGYLSWSSPEFTFFGKDSFGMFGLLPTYLESKGFEVKRAAALDAETLASADIVTFINILRPLSDEEHGRLWEFVRRGGSILVLGDHTGMGGIREPFNKLLEPVRVEFCFDSVKPFRMLWRDGLRSFPGPVTCGNESYRDLNIGVGASLAAPMSATVVLYAISGFADAGDAHNKDRAFLGDMAYAHGERLGDIPIVVACEYGKGRVLVFGDTSSFQNGSFGSGDRFIWECLQWLACGASAASQAAAIAAVLLAAGAAGLGLRSLTRESSSVWLGATLVAALAPAAFEGAHATTPPSVIRAPWVATTVDTGHGQVADDMWWDRNSLGGLHVNLLRNHMWLVPTKDLLTELPNVKCAILPAASIAYTTQELDALAAFVERGGVVISTPGHAPRDPDATLLRRFGVEVDDTPLGPAECEALGQKLKLACAYPLLKVPDGFEVLIKAYDVPVAGLVRMGAGAFVVISDSRFLANENLESRDQYIRENVMFVRSLFENLRNRRLL